MINAIAHSVEIYKKKNWLLKTEWRWKIIANNGKIIASSSEGYRNKEDLIKNMASTACSLSEHLSETEGGINYSKAKVTISKNNE